MDDMIALDLKLGLEGTLPGALVRGLKAVIARRRSKREERRRQQREREQAQEADLHPS